MDPTSSLRLAALPIGWRTGLQPRPPCPPRSGRERDAAHPPVSGNVLKRASPSRKMPSAIRCPSPSEGGRQELRGRSVYDLVIAGGRVIDPAQGLDGPYDVAFLGGKVAEVAPRIEPGRAANTLAADGALVVPGLIDLHTHVYWGATSLSVRPEPVARRSGATTLVDAGSAGAGNFHGFRELLIERSPVRILPYLNISFAGIFAFSKS